jgi:hypothetical protein
VSHLLRRRSVLSAMLALALAFGIVGVYAAQPSSSVHVCMNRSGTLKVVDNVSQCGRNEHGVVLASAADLLKLQGALADVTTRVDTLEDDVAALQDGLARESNARQVADGALAQSLVNEAAERIDAVDALQVADSQLRKDVEALQQHLASRTIMSEDGQVRLSVANEGIILQNRDARISMLGPKILIDGTNVEIKGMLVDINGFGSVSVNAPVVQLGCGTIPVALQSSTILVEGVIGTIVTASATVFAC